MTNETLPAAQELGNAPAEINGYPVHPFANLFPMMSDSEIEELAKDIKEHGQEDAIVLLDGRIVDGRNRMRACERAGVEPTTRPFEGTEADVLAFVVSKNLMRRHLTESQRAMIAAELANQRHGGDRKSDQAAPVPVDPAPPTTQAKAAEALKVSERSVRDAVAVKKADPVLADKVRAGTVTVKAAARQVREKKATVVQLRPEPSAPSKPRAGRRQQPAAMTEGRLPRVERATRAIWSASMKVEALLGANATAEDRIVAAKALMRWTALLLEKLGDEDRERFFASLPKAAK